MVLRDMSPPGRRSDVCDVRGSHDMTTPAAGAVVWCAMLCRQSRHGAAG